MDDDGYVGIPKSHLRQCINTITNYLHDGRDKADLAIACEMLHADSQQGPTLSELHEAEKALKWHIQNLEQLSGAMTRQMYFQMFCFCGMCVLNLMIFWLYGASVWAYVSQVLAFTAIGIVTLRARKAEAQRAKN